MSEAQDLRRHHWSLLPILGVYLILAFYGIERQSLWEDEFLSIQRTASPIPIWKDGHGFLYFALLNLWIQVGDSELALRSLSVLLGLGAVCLMYFVSLRLCDYKVAVIGTILFATSPLLIWYAQEVRYVTLMIAATLLAMWAFLRLTLRPRLDRWLAYGGATLLSLFCFLSNLILPLAHGLYLLCSPSRRPLLKNWIICHLVVFALFSWWFVHGTHFWQAFLEARNSNEGTIINNLKLFPFSGDWNNIRPAVLPHTFFALSVGFSIGPSLRELHAERTFAPLLPFVPTLLVLAGLYGGLLVSGLQALRSQRDTRMFLGLWLGIPILGVFGFATVLNLFYDVRYVAMVLPAYLLIIATGIVRFRRFGVQMLLLVAILAVHGVALANYYFDARYAREDTRSAAQFLESTAGSRDLVLVVGTVSSLRHYYRGNLPIVELRTEDEIAQSFDGRLRELSDDYLRLWLVKIRPWQADRAGKVKATLDRAFTLMEERHFPGVDVYAYRTSP